MLVVPILFAVLALSWGSVQVLAARLVRRAPGPDGDVRAAHRVNTTGLVLGVLTMILGVVNGPASLVVIFGELEAIDPARRAAHLSDGIDAVITFGGPTAALGVVVGVAAIALWIIRRRRLAASLSTK